MYFCNYYWFCIIISICHCPNFSYKYYIINQRFNSWMVAIRAIIKYLKLCIFLINNYALYFLPFHDSFKAVWFFCNFLMIPQFITLITWYCWQMFLTYCSSTFPDVEKHIPLHRFLWDFILSSVKTALLFLPLISYTLSRVFFFGFFFLVLHSLSSQGRLVS